MAVDASSLALKRRAARMDSKAHIRKNWRRAGAWVVKTALDARLGWRLVAALLVVHVVAWTIVISIGKWAETPNSDSWEAYAWGRVLQWGYGKHPPLSGWVARLWFEIFPTTDWALYALALVVTAGAALACWVLALQVVDRRRAFVVLLTLLIYPIFNFRSTKFNPDLLQVPLFVLVVLAFVIGFKRRDIVSGLILGFVCAMPVLAKYWALLAVGAVGLAALVHPDRIRFFRSATSYVAAIVFIAVLAPHVIWLVNSDYISLKYASFYLMPRTVIIATQAGRAVAHHAALLLPPLLALCWALDFFRVRPAAQNARIDRGSALQVNTVAMALIIGPPLAAIAIGVFFKSEWGIPLYSLVPLAIVAHARFGVMRHAIPRMAAVWTGCTAIALLVAPFFPLMQMQRHPDRVPGDMAEFAKGVTRLWHARFHTPLAVVAGPKFVAPAVSFYSPDHPVLFADFNVQSAPWIELDAVKRSGFLGICAPQWFNCVGLVKKISPGAQEVTAEEKLSLGLPVKLDWRIYFAAPEGILKQDLHDPD
jgi:hypothetical protein